jgi:acyl-[acyl-carrier-protein]-phospholipid O-acyltransferase/long-chain-fatty-acid--[acyl-carrier-protein] ligase
VLPPSAGALIANLAVVCAGKVPVNLNFTAGRASLEASLKLGEFSTVITAAAMREKLPAFPWPARTLDLKTELTALGRGRIVLWLAGVWCTPNQIFADLLGLPRRGGEDEAALLFTSGSSGEPKGVIYSHRNILANCWQISSTTVLPEAGRLLACLPLFHSFGFTITIWYGIIRRIRLLTVPSPLDTKKIADAIREEEATVVIGAPTFLRPLLKRAESRDLRSLELVVSGAEKLPEDLQALFRARYHIPVMQGYGLTETSPVISVNQHHAPAFRDNHEPQEGHRPGSVGRMLPGLTARIVDPSTMAELPLTETGLLLVRGPNVFHGYLRDEAKTRQAFQETASAISSDAPRRS